MKNKNKFHYIKLFFFTIVGGTIGYLIYYYFLAYYVAVCFLRTGSLYSVINIMILVETVLFFALLALKVFRQSISKGMIIAVSVIYVVLLFTCLFGFSVMKQEIILNPMESIRRAEMFNRVSLLRMELIAFIPLGWMLYRYMTLRKIFILMAVASFVIETAQYCFGRGSFQILDILLYVIGCMIGYLVKQESCPLGNKAETSKENLTLIESYKNKEI